MMMGDMVTYLLNQFILLMLVFIRMTGLVLSAPVLSHRLVPMQVRVLLALALALLILPVVTVPLPHVSNILEFGVMVASELAVGFVLGLGVMLMIQGMQLAGDIVSRMAGLGIGDVYDPTSDSELSGFSQLLFVVGMVVFLVTGGEKALLSGILESYAV
ncbi:flagellar biosynthetic protein FliR, partial [Thermogutta sp.]